LLETLPFSIGPSFEYLPCHHALVKKNNLLVKSGADQDPRISGAGTPKGCVFEFGEAAGEDLWVWNENPRAALQAMGRSRTTKLQGTDTRIQRELVVVMGWTRTGSVPMRKLVRLGAALELSVREVTRPQRERTVLKRKAEAE